MKPIKLFLTNFRVIVRNLQMIGEAEQHPTLYYSDERFTWFYKPVGSVLYYTELENEMLPDSIKIDDLKSEMKTIEIPDKIQMGYAISGVIQ